MRMTHSDEGPFVNFADDHALQWDQTARLQFRVQEIIAFKGYIKITFRLLGINVREF